MSNKKIYEIKVIKRLILLYLLNIVLFNVIYYI